MMGAFAIDNADVQRRAWRVLNEARSNPDFPKETLAKMEAAFYAWPDTTDADGKPVPFTEPTFKAVRDIWRKPGAQRRAEIAYTIFFRDRYEEVIRLFADARKLAGNN
jgi:hypothetical protein